MKQKFLYLTTTSLVMIWGLSCTAQAQVCATQPSCENLGFTQKATDCTGKLLLKCPFDTNKVFCGGANTPTTCVPKCPLYHNPTYTCNGSQYLTTESNGCGGECYRCWDGKYRLKVLSCTCEGNLATRSVEQICIIGSEIIVLDSSVGNFGSGACESYCKRYMEAGFDTSMDGYCNRNGDYAEGVAR